MLLDTARFFLTHPLTRRDLPRTFCRVLAWQCKSRANSEVVYDWIGGTKLAIRRGMRGATGNIYAGIHDYPDMLFLLHFLRAGDLFLDVGANVGSYTVLASGVRRARTLAFEPDPASADRLRRHIDINDIGDLVTVHDVAVGAADSDVAFTVGRDTMNRIAEAGDGDVRTVRQRSIDSLLGEDTPAMIKIDVEGHEDDVLRGAEETLSKKSLIAIQTEGSSDFLEGTLARHGFERAFYDPERRRLSPQPAGFRSANELFVRDDGTVSERLRTAPPVRVLNRTF